MASAASAARSGVKSCVVHPVGRQCRLRPVCVDGRETGRVEKGHEGLHRLRGAPKGRARDRLCLANLFFRWVEEVRAEILEVDKLKVSNIHIQFYGGRTGPALHGDPARGSATRSRDARRPRPVCALPAADRYDRPLLFVIANGVLRQGGSVFSFATPPPRFVLYDRHVEKNGGSTMRRLMKRLEEHGGQGRPTGATIDANAGPA